ncbi:MAG: glycosyltransferase [Sulfurovum sp.]|nr:glycosyltransferase [Sulfurovum sp.]
MYSLHKQLLIDISELVNQDSKTGIQRVVRSILKELLTNPPLGYKVEAVFGTPENEGYYYAKKFLSNFFTPQENQDSLSLNGQCTKTVEPPISEEPIQFNKGDIFLGLDLQHHVVLKQAPFYQKMREKKVKVYFIIYDLLPVLMPHVFHESVENLHHEWLSILAQNDGVICISKAVADEFKIWLKKHKNEYYASCQVQWFHLGADVDASVPTLGIPDDGNSVIKILSSSPTFLMVGTVEPRKGQEQTLASFELLWEQGLNINLVIVGKQGWDVEVLIEKITNHPELGKRLFWLNGISDEYLETVYKVSTCLIAASEGEGFGLPLIEAAQHKLPIIARDIPVFKEVAGEYAYYFENDNNPEVFVDTVKKWLELYEIDKHPKSDDMPWLTWEESTQALIKVLGT